MIKNFFLGSVLNTGTLLHECTHAISGADDVSRQRLELFVEVYVRKYQKAGGEECLR